MAGGVPQPGDHEDVAGELQPRHHTQVSRIILNLFSELVYFLLSLRLGVTKTIKKELKWPKEKNEIV